MRILLAAILVSNPDIMLLDEPTNHLDTESMEWLESWLKDYQGTIIAVAHDRMFLDKITTQTAELSNNDITIYKGNYSYYLKEKERRLEALRKEAALQRSEIKRTHRNSLSGSATRRRNPGRCKAASRCWSATR